jgi:hypothetical protein
MERKMSIAQNYPNLKPSLLLDFSNTEALDPRITFARASTATYYGTQTAKAEENLLLQSQDFTTSWSNASSTDTANTTAAPDGTTTADTVTASAATAPVGILQTVSVGGQTSVFSVFAKKDTQRYIQIRWAGDTTSFVNFDIEPGAGAVGTSGGTASGSIVDAGNGWYRCIAVNTTTTTLTQAAINFVTSTSAARNESSTWAGTETVFLWGAQLEQRSAATAYTPTTTQPITNYIPVLETAASGVARFDHNPTTFESLGLLVEEQRTNLLTYSEDFENAAWTKTRASITANTVVAPSGELTGDQLVEDTTASSTHDMTVSASFTSGTAYTISIYAKQAGRNLRIYFPTGAFGSAFSAVFDLSAGTATIALTGTVASITNVGNDWYRCSITQTATASATSTFTLRLIEGASTTSYTGDGYSGIFIWGAQLESSSFSTSYIPTEASQVTRASDAASMTGTNFSSWFNNAEGTMYAEGKSVDSITGTTARRFAEVNDGSTSNIMSIEFRNTTQSRFTVISSGTSQVSITSGETIDQFSKLAGAYATNNFAFSAGGILGTPDTSGTVPVVSQLNIGNRSDNLNTACINGHIKKIAYYPLAATSAQLQGLTS